MKRILIQLSLAFLLFCGIFLLSCGSDSDPTGPGAGPEPVPSVLPPDPDGMLLDGAADDPATAATVHLAPSPVAAAQISDRLLTTRLAAVIAPGATVGEVNAALAAHDAAIVSMLAGLPSVTLVIPALADRAEAETLAAALAASGAFAHVRPAFGATREVEAVEVAPDPDKDLPDPEVATRTPHAPPMRLPAAWNLRDAATDEAVLLHPNWYADVPGYSEIPQLAYSGFGEPVPASSPDFPVGSLGFYMLGVAAANWDYWPDISPHTGTDAAAAEALAVIAVRSYGLDASEQVGLVGLTLLTDLPSDPDPVVLLDTESFNDPEFEFYRFIDRAWLALHWRQTVHNVSPVGDSFVHVASAGTTRHIDDPYDDAILNSTAGVASLADLQAVAFVDATDDEFTSFAAAYQEAVAGNAAIAAPLTNVLIVGSSDAAGNESSFSAPGSDVRVVGEGVIGPCLVGERCDGVSIAMSNTATAAAQVAGLACYLWHLDGTLTPDDILLRLQHAYSASATPGILDASIAALSVERAGGAVELRLLLLDVDGPADQRDGVFDEHDIEHFLEAFDAFAGAIAPDYSVYDLNGDGWTNGAGTARMDLDVNDLPGFSTVDQTIAGTTVSFNESTVTDEEVLCYYAWSDLYTGDPEVRDELLADCTSGTGEVLAGSRSASSFDIDIESDFSGEYDEGSGQDRLVITDFGEHVTTADSTIALGQLSASCIGYTSASLHREDAGTVTLAVDLLATSQVQWPEEDDYARASADADLHLGLELTGQYTVSVSGRLVVDAPGDDNWGFIYAQVGPDSTLQGWWDPGGESWSVGGFDVETEAQNMTVGSMTIPEGTHRIWLNLQVDSSARDDSDAVDSGDAESSAKVEDLLIVLVPAEPGQASVRVLPGSGGRARRVGD